LCCIEPPTHRSLPPASFPHGVPPQECFGADASNTGAGLEPLDFSLLENGSQQMVVASSGKMKYKGQNYGRYAAARNLSKCVTMHDGCWVAVVLALLTLLYLSAGIWLAYTTETRTMWICLM